MSSRSLLKKQNLFPNIGSSGDVVAQQLNKEAILLENKYFKDKLIEWEGAKNTDPELYFREENVESKAVVIKDEIFTANYSDYSDYSIDQYYLEHSDFRFSREPGFFGEFGLWPGVKDILKEDVSTTTNYQPNNTNFDCIDLTSFLRITHENNKRSAFSCETCGKAFRQLSTLKQHLAIHSNDRPFNCKICEKSFNRISTLTQHQKIHLNIKSFQCSYCTKAFHQKGNLLNHLFTHTSYRPYRCLYCSKGFNQKSNLVCHSRKAHSENNFAIMEAWRCGRCEERFSKKVLLKRHELNVHGIKVLRKSRKIVAEEKPSVASTKSMQVSSSSSSMTNFISSGIFIPAINTGAMQVIRLKKEIPFAVLHCLEGVPVLVRVIDYQNQSLLRPANKDDFAALKKRSDKITVPVVATIYQKIDEENSTKFVVMPPQEILKSIDNKMLDLQFENVHSPMISGNSSKSMTTLPSSTKLVPANDPHTSSMATKRIAAMFLADKAIKSVKLHHDEPKEIFHLDDVPKSTFEQMATTSKLQVLRASSGPTNEDATSDETSAANSVVSPMTMTSDAVTNALYSPSMIYGEDEFNQFIEDLAEADHSVDANAAINEPDRYESIKKFLRDAEADDEEIDGGTGIF